MNKYEGLFNDSSQAQITQVLSGLYTGVSDFKVIEITGSSKMAYGEPVYAVKFTLSNDIIKTYLEIGVNSDEVISKTNKHLFINEQGDTSYANDEASLYENFKKSKVRKAKTGEAKLISFIKAYGNLGNDKSFVIEDFDKLCNGDLSVVTDIFKAIPENNKVRLLIGVKLNNEKYWHSVYDKQFFRPYQEIPYIKNYVELVSKKDGKQYNEFKDVQYTYDFVPFEQKIAEQVAVAKSDDDLPF
jgi:hypothetical protein